MSRPYARFLPLSALLLSVPLATCGDGSATSPFDRTPDSVIPRGGDAQSAEVGTKVVVPPSVVVLDPGGRPVAGADVTFTVTKGGGSITGAVTETDADGVAHVGSWTLGEQAGINELTAFVEQLEPAVMQATGRVGAPAEIVVIASAPETGLVGTPVSPAPRVRVVDRFGNPVPGVTVRFGVVEGGGTVAPAEVETDMQGLASATWTLGPEAGTNVLQVRVGDLGAVRFTVQAVEGDASAAVPIQGDDQQGAPGETLPQAPAVRIVDPFGNPVSGVEVTFTVVQGGGTVTPSVVTTDAQGVAETDTWTLGPEPGENVVEAAAEGVEPVRFNANAIEGQPSDLQLVTGDDQTAEVGAPVPIQPTVRLVDGGGNPVEGYPIDFVVEQGGGSVEPARVTTDAQGHASTTWTLGPDPGLQTMAAYADGFDRVVFTATATPGEAATLEIIAGEDQSAPTGGAVPVDPTVLVRDRFDNPVPGVTVTFESIEGGGSVTGGTVATDDEGIAAVGAWILGSTAGLNRLRISAGAATPVVLSATAVVAGQWNLDIRLIGDATQAQRQALESARLRWTSIIQGDLPPVQMTVGANACVEGQPAMNETIDDLVIYVRFDSIDGPGKVLGSAGPCFVRSGSRLPVVGIINLDEADLLKMETNGILETVILHEMGHVVGLGTLWSPLGLLVGEGGPDPVFIGSAALDAWSVIGGPELYGGTPVPVENTGGAGTRDGHWRESVLKNELMTGYVGQPPNPLSVLTIASLADVGYVVDLSEADSYQVTLAAPAPEAFVPVELREVPLPPPIEVDPGGRR